MDLIERDVEYAHKGTEMRGLLCTPEGSVSPLPGLVMIHGAHGLNDHIAAMARKFAALGYAVLAADLWGGRKQIGPDEISPMLDRFASDRALWNGRIDAARATLAAQPSVEAARISAAGYCFGGTSVLEYVRMGGELAAGISFHGGLDMVADDWSAARAGTSVLIATGDSDPLATPEDRIRIEAAMSGAGIVWETSIYGGVKHAFTEPDSPGRPPFAAYDPRADRRSFAAAVAILNEAHGL